MKKVSLSNKIFYSLSTFLLFFFPILIVSCQQKQGTQDLLIKSIANEDPNEIFTLHQGIIIFGKSNEERKLVYMDVYTLQMVYVGDSLFREMNYHEFVSKAINQKIIFDCNYTDWCFNISNEVISFFETNSFPEFLKTYTGKFTSTSDLYVKNSFSFDEKMTIIYCLSQHNYYTVFDDVIGSYIVSEMELPLIRQEEDLEFLPLD